MQGKKIGIWGFGTVGKSALTYLTAQGNRCCVLDKRELSPDENALLAMHNTTYLPEKKLDYFFSHNDLIFASPGIDINPYKHQAQFICELDIFTPAWHKPLIAITGTVGKTSTTTLLGNLLQRTMRVAIGGNIGTPMLSFLDRQDQYDCAILELSSWQLEHAQPFSPDLAIWTNLYPNHLDRHGTMDAYFKAKLPILLHQNNAQTAILPTLLYHRMQSLTRSAYTIWIDDTNGMQFPELSHKEQLLYIHGDNIMIKNAHAQSLLCKTTDLPEGTYQQNLFCVAAALHTLKLPLELLKQTDLSVEHRLEKVTSASSLIFYNDSKATVADATLAAIRRLKDKSVILFLGGLSKGVDRADLVNSLPNNITAVMCFGNEAEHLQTLCARRNIPCAAFATLEPAFLHAIKHANPGQTILFSPAGSSFDLYADYAERGKHFKQLVAFYTND